MAERVNGADEGRAYDGDREQGEGDAHVLQRRPEYTESELVQGMRRNEPAAFAEFMRRFRPLLLYEARRLDIDPALRDEFIDDCMADVAMRLRKQTSNVPRSLAPYLIRALRLHRLYKRRAEVRRLRHSVSDDWNEDLSIDATRAALSEATARASAGPSYDRPPTAAALERLVGMMDQEFTDDDRQLLAWLGSYVPQRAIAEWLGISHGAARNRVMRLRE